MLYPLIWRWNIIVQHLFTYVVHEGRILKWYVPFGLWVKRRLWNTHLIASVMPQLQDVYFCIQILEATFPAILAHFTFILFTSLLNQLPKAYREKWLFAVFQRKVPPAPSWSAVNQKPPTFLLKSEKTSVLWLKKTLLTFLTDRQMLLSSWNLPKLFPSNFT